MARVRSTWSLLRMVVGTLGVILLAGTAGYMLVGYNLGESLYFTVTTLTTVGFTPSTPLNAAGKVFTGVLAVLGVSAFLVILAIAAGAIAEGSLPLISRRRRMERRIENLRDHYIVCAYGRVGRAAARELEAEGVPFVVIDRKEELEEEMIEDGVLYIVEDPAEEETLLRAGVARAKRLLCALDSDAQNVFITITARSLNPDLFIVARASEPSSIDVLRRAGADRVVSPYTTSGRQMALLALRPRVANYLDMPIGSTGQQARVEEIDVPDGSALVGRQLGEVRGGADALLLRRADGRIISDPEDEVPVEAGDMVIVFGEPKTLRGVEGE